MNKIIEKECATCKKKIHLLAEIKVTYSGKECIARYLPTEDGMRITDKQKNYCLSCGTIAKERMIKEEEKYKLDVEKSNEEYYQNQIKQEERERIEEERVKNCYFICHFKNKEQLKLTNIVKLSTIKNWINIWTKNGKRYSFCNETYETNLPLDINHSFKITTKARDRGRETI